MVHDPDDIAAIDLSELPADDSQLGHLHPPDTGASIWTSVPPPPHAPESDDNSDLDDSSDYSDASGSSSSESESESEDESDTKVPVKVGLFYGTVLAFVYTVNNVMINDALAIDYASSALSRSRSS